MCDAVEELVERGSGGEERQGIRRRSGREVRTRALELLGRMGEELLSGQVGEAGVCEAMEMLREVREIRLDC